MLAMVGGDSLFLPRRNTQREAGRSLRVEASKMEYTILVLLFYCSLQVSADSSSLDVSDQNLERDRKNCAENVYRLQVQYWDHLSTLDLALKLIEPSLPVFEKREQELEKEVSKSRQLQNSLENNVLVFCNGEHWTNYCSFKTRQKKERQTT
ncbi:hypothetical protein B566_EDAN015469 [Ephemera danica]|nr:hypothetical protein B566_EDAN015469 [Ephemera danica]